MKKLALHWQILIALFLAVIFGFYFSEGVKYIRWVGEMFLNALKMVVIPLVFFSIISGVVKIGGNKNFGRLGVKTLTYYITTSLLAIITGLILVNIFKPGSGVNFEIRDDMNQFSMEKLSFIEIVKGIVPANIVDSMANGNVLPVIFFALLFGFFISQSSEISKKSLSTFFESAFEVMMKMTHFIIRFTPLGIFAIVASEVARNSDKLSNIAGSLSIYMLTVILGLLIHSTITLPVMVKLIGRANTLAHFKNMLTPLLTAFSTSSSSATLPMTMDAVENRCGVSNKISSFTLPLGATMNMDGTALYECVAALFIAQVYGIHLSIGMQLIVVATALLTSIGAAGIPMAGLVMISVILSAVNLPLEGMGIILAVDRILDMFRTSVNVWSDSCGAVIIAKSEGEKLNV